jgi:plasmid stabilization system protein ParE
MIEIVHASSSWRDQKRIIDYLDRVGASDAALRFLEALDETIALIAELPDMGHPWESEKPRHAGLRYRLVKGFESYLVFYKGFDRHVLVMRVLHASQDIGTELG